MLFILLLKLKHLDASTSIMDVLNLDNAKNNLVTFCDRSKIMIHEKGITSIQGISQLNGVLFMDILKENLISISQIYDGKCLVEFTHKEYILYGNIDSLLLRVSGQRTPVNILVILLPFCATKPISVQKSFGFKYWIC